jgi:O-antigen/teichoic acid export membrane protein
MSKVIAGFLGIVRGLLIARWLGPEVFGTWRFINIFVNYISLASLGTWAAVNRRIPYLRGKQDIESIKAITDTVFATNFFSSIIYSMGVFGFSFFVQEEVSAFALAAFSPILFLLIWTRYAERSSLANGLYDFCTKLQILEIVLLVPLSIILVYIYGLYGAISGYGLATFIIVIYAAHKLKWQFQTKIDWRILWSLILVGLPIVANDLLVATIDTADKMLIAAMLNHETLGIYGAANVGINALKRIPISLGQMLFIKFAEMDGQGKTKEHVLRVLDETIIILSAFFSPIISLAIASFPIMIVLLLPRFIDGIAAGRILIASVFFYSLSSSLTNLCISTGHFASILILRLILVILEFISIYLAITYNASLEIIALCVLSIYIFNSFFSAFIVSKILENSIKGGIILLVKGISPFFSILITLLTQYYIYPIPTYELGARLFTSCIISFVLGLVVSTPFIYLANKHINISGIIRNITRPYPKQ